MDSAPLPIATPLFCSALAFVPKATLFPPVAFESGPKATALACPSPGVFPAVAA